MLVLSRKAAQQIKIGDSITLTVVRIRGNVVSLGIDAPNDTSIRRAELGPKTDANGRTGKDAEHGDVQEG